MLLNRQATEEVDEHIDMTPMVDVVFQLMTFFLFSVQMTGGEQINVPPAKNGIGVQEDEAIFLTLQKPEREGATPILREGKDGSGPITTIETVKQYIEAEHKKGLDKVVLQADGDVPHGEFLKVAGAVTEVDGVTLHVGVQQKD